MKPIIIISAYCPDDERKLMLENCVNSLQPIRKDFDILISTHSYIPEYIGKKTIATRSNHGDRYGEVATNKDVHCIYKYSFFPRTIKD